MTGQEAIFNTNEPLANTSLTSLGEALNTFSDTQLRDFIQDVNALCHLITPPPQKHSRRELIAATFAPLILSIKGLPDIDEPILYSRRDFLKHLEMTLIALAFLKVEYIANHPDVTIDHTQSTIIVPFGDSLAAAG